MNNRRGANAGYSLAEIIVVVAIIGLVSLVTVPNFISMQRNGRLKTSMRQFTTDLRQMRQRAVTKHVNTKVGFLVGTTATQYSLYEQSGGAWVQVGTTKSFQNGCYFKAQTQFRTDRDANSDYDLIFIPDGTVTYDANVFAGTIQVATDFKVGIPLYTITISKNGSVKVVGTPAT